VVLVDGAWTLILPLLTLLFYYFISSYYSRPTRCWNLSLYTIRFINQISKKVPYETFSISFHFHKIVYENTFALTPPCFIWVSRAIAKHARIVLTAFLSMFKLHCQRHYRNLATYRPSWCTTWREHVTKTAPARRRHSVVGGGGDGGGGVGLYSSY